MVRYSLKAMGKKTTINESPLGSLIVRLAILGGAAVMRVLAPLIFQTLIRGIARTYYGVKDMVAPEKWLKFVKKLEKSNSFNIEFIKFLKERFRKGSPKIIDSRFVDDVLNLPAFVDEFNKFVKDEEIVDVEKLRSEIRSDMESSFRNNLGDIYKFLKKTYPELTTDLEESLYMFEAKHTKGGIYKGKLKIGGVPVPVEVEMVGADNKTRSYLVKVIDIDNQYWSKLPKDGIIPIPARLFDGPGGGWVKVKTPSVFEDAFPGGLADKYSVADLAKKHGISVDEIKSQIAKGMKVEMEHTNDKKVAFEIAKDHIFENPKYYDKLKTIENRVVEILKKKSTRIGLKNTKNQ